MGGMGMRSPLLAVRAPLGYPWAVSHFPCWWDIVFKSETWGVSGSRLAGHCRMQPGTLFSLLTVPLAPGPDTTPDM